MIVCDLVGDTSFPWGERDILCTGLPSTCRSARAVNIARLELEWRSFAGQFLRVSSPSWSTKALTPARTWPRASPASPRAPSPLNRLLPYQRHYFVNNLRYFRKSYFHSVQKSLASTDTSRTTRVIPEFCSKPRFGLPETVAFLRCYQLILGRFDNSDLFKGSLVIMLSWHSLYVVGTALCFLSLSQLFQVRSVVVKYLHLQIKQCYFQERLPLNSTFLVIMSWQVVAVRYLAYYYA